MFRNNISLTQLGGIFDWEVSIISLLAITLFSANTQWLFINVGVDHDKIILLSTSFQIIPIFGTTCCCNVIFVIINVGNQRYCIVLFCIVLLQGFGAGNFQSLFEALEADQASRGNLWEPFVIGHLAPKDACNRRNHWRLVQDGINYVHLGWLQNIWKMEGHFLQGLTYIYLAVLWIQNPWRHNNSRQF